MFFYFKTRSLNEKRKYKFPKDCYGYFCPKLGNPVTKQNSIDPKSVDRDWAGLTILSNNILVVSMMIAMTSVVCSIPAINSFTFGSRLGEFEKQSRMDELENFIATIELL